MKFIKTPQSRTICLLVMALAYSFTLSAQGSTGANPSYIFFRTLNGGEVGTPVGSTFYRSLTNGQFHSGAAMRALASGPGVDGFMPMDFIFETGENSLTEQLRLTALGLVGVNTKNPEARMHIFQAYNSVKPIGPLFKVTGEAGDNIAHFTISHLPADSSLLYASLMGEMTISAGNLLVEDQNVEVRRGKVIVEEDNVEIARGKLLVNTTEEVGNHVALFNGSIIATEAWIKEFPAWPDYVFQDDYTLMTLPEVKKYIDKHGHLPEVPSAQTIREQGVKIGEMQTILLRKIEELTLYVIQLQENHEQEIEQLKAQLSKQ